MNVDVDDHDCNNT